MRDLLNLLDTLSEARGLSARKPGEVYARIGGNTDDDKITFQSLDFYPDQGSYQSVDQMMDVLDQLETQAGIQFEKINQPTARTRAFGVAGFDTAVGRRYLVKFASDIKPVRTQNTFFQTKDIPGGFSQTDARGSKEKAGYKPSDVLTDFRSQTPATILAQIADKFGDQSDEYNAALIIANATQFPVLVPAGNMDFKGFRDYFCEMLQPCVLINGAPVRGNAAKAAEVFMGQNGFADCVVSFNQNVSGTLYDSLLVNPAGKQIKLSSKGAKGAMASVINLLKSARELEDAGLGNIVEPYQEIIDILKIIDDGDHNSGPLNLAIEQEMITPDEAEQVMTLKQYAGQPGFDIDDTDLSDNLKKIYKERTAEDPSKIVPLNHMVASIAYKVCNEINTTTNFSEAAADILNNSAFVQMYTDAKQKDDQFIIEGFTTVWPSKLFTDVTLEAQKSYSSTSSSGGKLVFNINKEPKAVPNVEQGATTDAPGPSQAGELVDFIPPRSNLKAVDTKQKAPADDASAFGRKKRKSF
jgi:hypothetical protein